MFDLIHSRLAASRTAGSNDWSIRRPPDLAVTSAIRAEVIVGAVTRELARDGPAEGLTSHQCRGRSPPRPKRARRAGAAEARLT